MDKEKLLDAKKWINEQLDICADFWLKNGLDKDNGGMYTCLDRTGKVYSTDKSVWMQGRAAWTFAFLCHMYGVKNEWLDASKSCLDFMKKYCHNEDAEGRMYFTVTKDGKPLRQRRYYFSEAFCAMGNAEYYGLTGDENALADARAAFDMYYSLSKGEKDPVGMPPKTNPEVRSGKAFGIPMILLNVCSVMIRTDPERKDLYEKIADECVDNIFKYFVHPELKCVLENVDPQGNARLEFSEGRIVNPGHDIEAVWFLLECSERTGNKELVEKAASIFDNAINAGWDKEYGGLLYFLDVLGNPPESYEHDMKLWWPHNEILISSIMLYKHTGREEYLDWFYKCLDYCKTYFADKEYGEWYGYLRRDGKPTMPSSKGSTFKGPFHLPRCLMMVDKTIGEILA